MFGYIEMIADGENFFVDLGVDVHFISYYSSSFVPFHV
jgi:hypothetical protein